MQEFSFLIMVSNFKIMYALVVMLWQCWVLIYSTIAIITIKNIACSCVIHKISKSEAINLSRSSALVDRGYI